MQHELTAGELLDAWGALVECGWARSETRRYRRAAIRAPWYRIKEWDYYCVLAGGFGLALTVADNGYMGFLAASWLDFRKPVALNDSVMIPFPRGRMVCRNAPTRAMSCNAIQRSSSHSIMCRAGGGCASIAPASRAAGD